MQVQKARAGRKPNYQHLTKAGRLIVDAMREKDMQNVDAAKAIGIGRDYLSQIIHARRLPSLRVANLINKHFGVPTDVYRLRKDPQQ